jgi:hypothetical protein
MLISQHREYLQETAVLATHQYVLHHPERLLDAFRCLGMDDLQSRYALLLPPLHPSFVSMQPPLTADCDVCCAVFWNRRGLPSMLPVKVET